MGKIYKLHTNQVLKLEAPWIKVKGNSMFNFIVNLVNFVIELNAFVFTGS